MPRIARDDFRKFTSAREMRQAYMDVRARLHPVPSPIPQLSTLPPQQVELDRDIVSDRYAERAGESDGHDQAEQDLRNPVHRIEDTILQSRRRHYSINHN